MKRNELYAVDINCPFKLIFQINSSSGSERQPARNICSECPVLQAEPFLKKEPAAAEIIEWYELYSVDIDCPVKFIFPNKNRQRRQEINGKKYKQWMSRFTSRFF